MLKMKWCFASTFFLCFVVMGDGNVFSSLGNLVYNYLDVETCNDHYINQEWATLHYNLNSRLFGQHLVVHYLPKIVENHFTAPLKKPLVISFHGCTGCGKNYASSMVAESMYRRGMMSKFVHFFSGRLHFPQSNPTAVEKYTTDLQNWIRGNVSVCPKSMFIFDEIDKIPVDLVEAIKPFFDFHQLIDSIDYRQTIFIFLSNVGQNVIIQKYVELWSNGMIREDMKYIEFESALRKSLYKTDGLFHQSSVIEDHLISMYLPFLPLEKVHLRKCIHSEMMRQSLDPTAEHIEQILDDLEFYDDRFSISGCKRVHDAVARFRYRNFDEL